MKELFEYIKELKLEDIIKDFFNVRSAITLGAFYLAYYLMATNQPLPDLLKSIIDLLLGFWFGEKVARAKINGEKIPPS